LSKLRILFEDLFAGPSVLVFGDQNIVTCLINNNSWWCAHLS